jgi:hypothetical protein
VRARLLALIVLVSAGAGGFYAAILDPPDVAPWMQVAIGATIGAFISTVIIGIEVFGERRAVVSPGARLPFAVAVVLRTAAYSTVIVAALLVVPWLYTGEPLRFLRPGFGRDVAFSFAATFTFVALVSVIRTSSAPPPSPRRSATSASTHCCRRCSRCCRRPLPTMAAKCTAMSGMQ